MTPAPDKNEDNYFKYAQIGLELAGAVGLGFWAGYKLDARLGTSPWLMLVCSAAGLAAGFYLILLELPQDTGPKRGKPS